MIGAKTKVEMNTRPLKKAVEKDNFRNLGHAAFSIRKDAAKSIAKAKGPSEPGEPIHTHRRIFARRALRVAQDREAELAVVGPRASMVGESFAAHEFGEEFRGANYPERPTMQPALERNLDRFASEWGGQVG